MRMGHMTDARAPPSPGYLGGYSGTGRGPHLSSSAPLKRRVTGVRRTGLLLASMALTVLLASGVALAINTIQCKTNKSCYGTRASDLMKGSAGSDWMYGKGGADTLKGFGNTPD